MEEKRKKKEELEKKKKEIEDNTELKDILKKAKLYDIELQLKDYKNIDTK